MTKTPDALGLQAGDCGRGGNFVRNYPLKCVSIHAALLDRYWTAWSDKFYKSLMLLARPRGFEPLFSP
jgi:hypothetical protein